MEGTELEEGEACSYQHVEDTNIDLDALTYIDEKLQNVLGHLKKDFEGGVSSENLGAKFGGYGSFLIQRSPIWSYSRSPTNVQDDHSLKSPTCLSAEGGHSSLSRPNGYHSTKHESSSVRSASSEFYKAPSEHDTVRKSSRAPFKSSNEEVTTKFEAVDKSNNMKEQKTLKVRIKVGSDNMSAKKKTDLYSGLGLASPSSSIGDSPIGIEGISQGFQFSIHESPTQIIRIMTSIPIYGGHLLSPLPEGLARLTEKLLQCSKVEPAFRQRRGNSVPRSNQKTAKIVPGQDTLKSEERSQLSSKHKEDTDKALPDVNLIWNNQVDLDSEACEVLVGEALKLPLLSDSYGSSRGKKGTSKQKSNIPLNLTKHSQLMPILSRDDKCTEKQIAEENLAVKVAGEVKVESQTDIPCYPKRDGESKGGMDKSSPKLAVKDISLNSRNGSINGPGGSQKQKHGKICNTVEQEEKKLPSGREPSPSLDKRKQKRSHITGSAATDIHKVSIKNTVAGNNNSSHASGILTKQKDTTKYKDKYKDFFGDMIEDGDDLIDTPDGPSNNAKLEASQISEQGLLPFDYVSIERSETVAQEQVKSKLNSKRALNLAPTSVRVPSNGESASVGAPVEDWVQCDKCLKWRLLPFGTKLDSLPEKWHCSMLSWLPGMNTCNITEEETTKAVADLNQSQNRNGVHGSLTDIVPVVTEDSDSHLTQTRRNIFPGGAKKQNDMKEGLKSNQEAMHLVKSTSLTNTAGSHLENELHFQHLKNLTDTVLETDQRKKKSQNKLLDSYSDGGHSQSTRLGSQRESNQDYPRPKKMKIEEEAHISTHAIANELLIHNSSNELPPNGAQTCLPTNHRSSSSRSSKGHIDDSLQDSIKKSKSQSQALPYSDCLDARQFNGSTIDTKKRKERSSIDIASPIILSDNMVSESEQIGQKKARLSLPEENHLNSSQGKGRIDKRKKGSKDRRLGKDVGSTVALDDHRSLKRNLGHGATSSSSKVLDSKKSKSIIREVRNLPVEAVSSSPFRAANLDVVALEKKNPREIDGSCIAGINKTKEDSKSFADKDDERLDSSGERSSAMRKSRIDGCLVDTKVQMKDLMGPSSGHVAGCQADDTLDQHNMCTSEAPVNDAALNQYVKSACNDDSNGLLSKQSSKVSSRSKDKKNEILKSASDKGKVKIGELYDESQDHPHIVKDKAKDIRMKLQENPGCSTTDLDVSGKNNPSGIMLDEASKENGKPKLTSKDDPIIRADSMCDNKGGSVAKKNVNTDCGENLSKSFDLDKVVEMELLSGKETCGNKGDLSNRNLLTCQGNGSDASRADVHDRGKGLKEQSSNKKLDTQNGTHSSSSKHKLSNAHRLKGRDTPSPMRRESHNQTASSALKEAKDMKHLADRIKNSGSAESTGLYFQAVLKFLHAACLLESSGSENSKRGDIILSMQVYSTTAKLCEFCAHEYEKSKDLASAALVYKCMEVAYMRVVYSSHNAANRDRHELQTSLHMAPPGESPSSSASDIDNASNPAIAAEKAAQVRDGNSPQPAGNHVISARNRPIFSRLLNFMQDVNSAMEASRKSQGAFAAAKVAMQQADSKEGIASVKRVLDFNFHDVNGLLRLVRLGMEAIKQ